MTAGATPYRTAQDIQIQHLEGRVTTLEASDRSKDAKITELLVAMGRLETRQAIWGVVATVAAPLLATGAAWMVVRSAGAQVVVPAQTSAAVIGAK